MRLNEEERTVYASFRRPYMRLGFVLNTVYYTSTVWLVIGGSSLMRRRVVRRRTLAGPDRWSGGPPHLARAERGPNAGRSGLNAGP